MIDSHAHIYQDPFAEDLEEVISRSIDAGVSKILMPNIDVDTIEPMLSISKKYPAVCYPMLGLHPCSVKEDFEHQLGSMEMWLEKESFIAVGEIGTDLYWDKTFWEQQKEAFLYQCDLALRYNLPIVVHCRETIDETIDLVAPYAAKGLTGVFHCFVGSREQAIQITEMGFYVGLGGVSTFKNGGLDQVIPHLDLSKVLLETDSPYLAPTPHRGKRNEPAYTRLVASKVASYCSLTLEEINDITTKNTETLFFT